MSGRCIIRHKMCLMLLNLELVSQCKNKRHIAMQHLTILRLKVASAICKTYGCNVTNQCDMMLFDSRETQQYCLW